MLKIESRLGTDQSQKYVDMLSHHFARKVDVDRGGEETLVHFPMGKCWMRGQDKTLHFVCEAESEQALLVVRSIIDKHMHLLKKIRDQKLQWSSVNE